MRALSCVKRLFVYALVDVWTGNKLNKEVLLCVLLFTVENLRCKITVDAGFQCQCLVDNVYRPLNGTDCIGEFKPYTK